MAQVLVTEDYLTAIANAIRSKSGLTVRYKPSEMAAAITALSTGSSSGGSESGGGNESGNSGSGTKTKLGSFTVQSTAEGALTGYTIGRLIKVIPNGKAVHFKAVITCPTGLLLDMMAISDFKTGRAWGNKNAYCAAATETTTDTGKTYTMEWDEAIAETTYMDDDDQAKQLLTYYCCSESKVKQASGSTTALSGATLTVEAYA